MAESYLNSNSKQSTETTAPTIFDNTAKPL